MQNSMQDRLRVQNSLQNGLEDLQDRLRVQNGLQDRLRVQNSLQNGLQDPSC